ncbi:MAG: hypothetical protein RBT63_04015 [Bdellovibrionales bacterium]|nr:hypothetical protein [Bdellovibrionales bacterium]
MFRLLRALAGGDTEECAAIVSEWKEKGAQELSFSHELEASLVEEENRAAVELWNAGRFEALLRQFKEDGWQGIRTDLKAREALLTTFAFGAAETMIEHKVLGQDTENSPESSLDCFLRVWVQKPKILL